MEQPHILPSARPHSTINDQCKVPHECLFIEINLLIMCFLMVNHGNNQKEDEENVFF